MMYMQIAIIGIFLFCTGKSQKKLNKPDNGFDIAEAMKTRKPLRKTSTAISLQGTLTDYTAMYYRVHTYQQCIIECILSQQIDTL